MKLPLLAEIAVGLRHSPVPKLKHLIVFLNLLSRYVLLEKTNKQAKIIIIATY